jgi:EPS-associated MarR family transcriptional regulator
MKLQEELNLLRKISVKDKISQRELAKKLGFSLGKLNYCIIALKKKGFLKIKNFKNNKNKIGYIYLLTPKGISKKTKLMISFMNRTAKEYNELKREIKILKNEKRIN